MERLGPSRGSRRKRALLSQGKGGGCHRSIVTILWRERWMYVVHRINQFNAVHELRGAMLGISLRRLTLVDSGDSARCSR
jgi:hypothetical protein